MKARVLDHARLHWVVFLWSLTAILGKLLSLHFFATVSYRTWIGAAGLWIWMLLRKRATLQVPLRDTLVLMMIGWLIGVHWTLFFASVQFANASVCLIGISTTTLWTALLEPVFTSKKLAWFEVALGMVALAGMAVIFGSGFQFQFGLTLALGAALFAAVFGILNGRIRNRYAPEATTFYEMSGACLVCVLISRFNLHRNPVSTGLIPAGWDWLWLLVLAFLCTTYAYVVYIDLLKVFSVFVVSLVANLEPVYGIILAAVILGEGRELSPHFYLGAAIVMTAIVLHSLAQRNAGKALKSPD